MNAFRRHWYSLGLIPAAVMAAWLAWNWDGIVWVQKLLALNFIVLILHQFEEYAWPGGFPWICNEVLTPKSGGPPDRYPLNQNNAAFINVFGWLFYLVPVLLPRVIWLGFGQMLFGLVGQVIVHGVIINSKLKTWYNRASWRSCSVMCRWPFCTSWKSSAGARLNGGTWSSGSSISASSPA